MKTKKTATKRTKKGPLEKEFLSLFPTAAVKAAVKRVKEMGSIETDAARDMFLYGYSYAQEDRAKRAKKLLQKARQSHEWIDDTLNDDDCEVVECDRYVLFNIQNILFNLIRAIDVSDAPPYADKDDDDEPRIVDDDEPVKPAQDAGKDAVIASLRTKISALEGVEQTLHVVIEKIIRLAIAEGKGY